MLHILLALALSTPPAAQDPALRLALALTPQGVLIEAEPPRGEPLWLLIDREPGPARVGGLTLGVGLSSHLRVERLEAGGTTLLPLEVAAAGPWYVQAFAPSSWTVSAPQRVGGPASSAAPLVPCGPSSLLFVDGATGNDANPGTAALPWRTIQHAADHATPGSTVVIAPGVYRERVVVHVSGSAVAGPITFAGHPAGGTIVDGAHFGNTDFADWSGAFGLGLIDVTDRSWLRFEDLEVRGLATTNPNYFLMGFTVAKTPNGPNPVEHVELHRLNVHDIRYTGANDSGGAQGVTFYGGHTELAMREVELVECRIHHLRLGQSEAVTFNGNVEGFRVMRCQIYDNDNIGLSLIGWEGTAGGSSSDDDSDANAHLYGGHHPSDQARDGIVLDNLVWRCSTEVPVKNTTYPVNDFSAGGIYVDGGRDIVIQRNFVYECDIGIDLGCEHGGVDDLGQERSVRNITCRNNVAYYCGQAGISLGGYNRFRGVALECEVLNNTVVKCSSLGWGGGQVQLGKSRDNLIAGNILYARGSADVDDYDGYQNTGDDWEYDHGVVLGSAVGPAHNIGNELAGNLYFTEDGIANVYWKWEMGDNQDPVRGWSGLVAIDPNGLFGDPLFVQGTYGRADGSEDYRLSSAGSPAVDSGDGTLDVGYFDAWQRLRLAGAEVDRGANEWGSRPGKRSRSERCRP